MSGQLEDFDNISHYLLYRYRTLEVSADSRKKDLLVYTNLFFFFFCPIKKNHILLRQCTPVVLYCEQPSLKKNY